MVNEKELLTTARTLYSLPNATSSDFDRSVSTAYYAVFSHICAQYSTLLFGGADAGLTRARLQAFRAVSHTEAKAACFEITKRKDYGFPDEIVVVAVIFIMLQKEREEADYNPTRQFTRTESQLLVDQAELLIDCLAKVEAKHRVAFISLIATKRRGSSGGMEKTQLQKFTKAANNIGLVEDPRLKPLTKPDNR
jgi:uncharacterized protein (UPF0332 family)